MMEIGEKWVSTHARTDLRMENRPAGPARVPRVDECLDIQSLGEERRLAWAGAGAFPLPSIVVWVVLSQFSRRF